jgi:1-acyl-sn-glycerol-3-phosphate acyltransferase
LSLLTAKPTTFIARTMRFAGVALHLMSAVATVALGFPFLNSARRAHFVRRWSARLLDILAVRIEFVGTPPAAAMPAMIVSNHVSWLDIFAINAVRAVRFVGKSDIRRWPVAGWLCEQVGTLFIDRTRPHHTARINRQVAAALREGDTFAVFPEGTTTAGNVLLPFHAALLQPALACDARLYPVAIRYTRADGSLCSEADYDGDKSLVDTFKLMLTQPVINVRLEFLPPLACGAKDRRQLAHAAAAAIARALNLPVPRSRAEAASGRKA